MSRGIGRSRLEGRGCLVGRASLSFHVSNVTRECYVPGMKRNTPLRPPDPSSHGSLEAQKRTSTRPWAAVIGLARCSNVAWSGVVEKGGGDLRKGSRDAVLDMVGRERRGGRWGEDSGTGVSGSADNEPLKRVSLLLVIGERRGEASIVPFFLFTQKEVCETGRPYISSLPRPVVSSQARRRF